MTPSEIGEALGDISRGDEVLASIEAGAGPEVAKAIRKSFEPGDEQGNGRRLQALVTIEGEGALDVVKKVLANKVVVGGIYSNLQNLALEIMKARFLGHPALEKPLWRAIEIDEYLNIDDLYVVTAAYDPERALALLVPQAELGVPAALRTLASLPEGRSKFVQLLDAAIAAGGDKLARFIEGLGDVASQPELAARIAPLAETLPTAAEALMASDPARARKVADQLASKDARWRAAAVRALALLPPAEVFERISPMFVAADRAKAAVRNRIDAVLWSLLRFEDPRWLPFLTKQLAKEATPKLRAMIVRGLGKVGPAAINAIISAPKDDKDTAVILALPLVLAMLRGDGVTERVRKAAASATGKHQRALKRALAALEG